MSDFLSFQEIITRLNLFWQAQGCVLIQPLDMEVGAGTFHPATFLRSIGPEPWRSAYVQPSRRPTDGRYGDNPNRLQHYYQYQVLLKPAPANLQQLYLQSLQAVGIDLAKNDARFVEDNWESPTLGAWGLGWEVWLNGMEVTQFTYFQQAGGLECKPVSGELTYGLERLAMSLQGVDSVYDLVWTHQGDNTLLYHQIYHQNEVEQSQYNFKLADVENLFKQFETCYQVCHQLVAERLPLPAYEQVMKASHFFNLLDARKAISVTERQRYIFRVRELAYQVALCYAKKREELDYPLGVIENKKSNESSKKIDCRHLYGIEKADFLFELGCEELPTNSVLALANGLKQGFIRELGQYGLAYDDIMMYATPRRLAVKILCLSTVQISSEKKRKGPRIDAPEQARVGFARRCGVELSALAIERISGVDYLIHHAVIEGKHFSELLPNMVATILPQLPVKKTMRWEANDHQFPRPVRWVVSLLGSQVAPCTVFGVQAGNWTYGHRVDEAQNDGNGSRITLNDTSEYEEKLRQHSVLADFSERKNLILKQIEEQTIPLSAKVNMDEDLLNQVCALTEFPTAVVGAFPEKFLNLPRECLMTTLQTHQKYFTLKDEENGLLPFFITISNLPSQDFDAVKKGNERVVVPRLEDAEFFWQQDLQTPLQDYLERLHAIIFVDGLGTMHQKVQRVKKLAVWMALNLQQETGKIEKICDLMKCDLVTDMVNEFPELQGIMGKYYALASGETAEIANAIADHYLPKQAYDDLPPSMLSAIVAIADKIDTIVGIHLLQKQPSGSSDPFALRRAALGVMQIFEQKKINLHLTDTIVQCITHWQAQLHNEFSQDIQSQIESFMWGRLHSLYTKDREIPVPFYQAVLAVKPLHPYEFSNRLKAVQDFVQRPEAKLLSETNTRIKNILQKNPLKSKSMIHIELFEFEQEKQLFSHLQQAQNKIKQTDDYLQILIILCGLATPVEQFFDHVMVLDENQEKRTNRLTLLFQLRQCFLQVADISLLQLR